MHWYFVDHKKIHSHFCLDSIFSLFPLPQTTSHTHMSQNTTKETQHKVQVIICGIHIDEVPKTWICPKLKQSKHRFTNGQNRSILCLAFSLMKLQCRSWQVIDSFSWVTQSLNKNCRKSQTNTCFVKHQNWRSWKSDRSSSSKIWCLFCSSTIHRTTTTTKTVNHFWWFTISVLFCFFLLFSFYSFFFLFLLFDTSSIFFVTFNRLLVFLNLCDFDLSKKQTTQQDAVV